MRSVFKRDAVRVPGDRTCNRHTYHARALKRHYNGSLKGMGYFIFFSANQADARRFQDRSSPPLSLANIFSQRLCQFRVLLFDLLNRAGSLLLTSTFLEFQKHGRFSDSQLDTVNEPRIKRHDRFELSEPLERLEHASVSGILGTSASNVRALDLLKAACPLSLCLKHHNRTVLCYVSFL
jgi:hypothetical protein